ncbi:HEAT repeat domain-containing protein [Streptomyces sp. MP131-18]|uniref:HEAT repeat domain-containing protein n=1 Tax=Streptomyces sp. MP131-18 TaxID=1857892 RepID=UPI00097C8F72|nr:HEAT repeat domain-containing protein [Streptomyces sp. MP131-18]
MFASPTETGIAPSGTLLGLLQRGRGDGWLHALAAPRAQAVAALERCVLHDPRQDWQLEHRSLYYARLYVELDAPLDTVAAHLLNPDDAARPEEERTGLALSVLGHLTSYGNQEAMRLLRRYAVVGANWRWALDELAVRDDDTGLRALGPEILARFPRTDEGEAALTAAVRDSFEPRPWHIWAADPGRPGQRARLERALEHGDFDRWQRQLRPPGPQPGWSVHAVLQWAHEGYERTPRQWREAAAARCLGAVAGPEDRPELLAAAACGQPAVRAAALRHLAERGDPEAFTLISTAAAAPDREVASAAVTAFSRMRGDAALIQARQWARRTDDLGACAASMLAGRGQSRDAPLVLAALLRTVRTHGSDARELLPLVEGAGRLAVCPAVPVLRHVYRETSSSHLRGHTARALAVTDPTFAAGFAVECLWDCEEDTREVAARFATTVDTRVVERLRRLATDPAERAGVQTAVRGRLAGRGSG